MNNSFSAWMFKHFYHSAVKAELKRRGFPQSTADKIISEYDKIAARAKDIGKSRLISSYTMGIYFIAMNRSTGKDAEENFEIFRDGLCASKLFRKAVGNAESLMKRRWQDVSSGRRTATRAYMKMTGCWISCRETTNMTWAMTIISAVYARYAATRAALSWRSTFAEWTLCLRTLWA